MLIGCISDTHIHDGPVPDTILSALEGVDMILHAGDIVELNVIDALSEIADTIAVRGNMDSVETARALPEKRLVDVEGFRIGLTHGSGAPVGIVSRVASVFEGEGCDCIVFGHTHRALNEVRGDVLFFNPGSATRNIFSRRNTIGMLDVGSRITGRIVDLEAWSDD
jgi:hypothetical protein